MKGKIKDLKPFTAPGQYQVYCEAESKEGHASRFRIGNAHDAQGVKDLIKHDREAMNQTYNGMVAGWSGTRNYRVFHCAAWTEITAELEK